MSIFDMLFGPSMDERISEAKQQKGALVVDVRTPQEFSSGHIPGAINIPLNDIEQLEKKAKDKEQPLYLYCASGARSSRAAKNMQAQGYTRVVNLGGIGSYSGALER